MSEYKAVLLLELQTGAARSVLLTIEGLGRVGVENAINVALAIVRAPVNAVLGFRLL